MAETASDRNHAAHEAFWLSMRTKGKRGNIKRAIDAAVAARIPAPGPAGEALAALKSARDLIDDSAFNIPSNTRFHAVTKELDAAIAMFPPSEECTQIADDDELDEHDQRLIDEAWERHKAAKPADEHRQTFTVPDGFEPVFDAEGRATGEIRPAGEADGPGLLDYPTDESGVLQPHDDWGGPETDGPAGKDAAQFLWGLLDDIDTASDRAKGDNAAYREIVERVQRRRFEVGSTDGYAVTFHPQEKSTS